MSDITNPHPAIATIPPDRPGQDAGVTDAIAAARLAVLLQRQDRAFVEHAYLQLFRRKPDAGGMTFYLGRLRAGTSKAQILRQMLDSPEATADPGAVADMRQALDLALAAPAPGHTDAIAAPGAAKDLDGLLRRQDSEFVRCAYLTLLKRPPDPSGFDYYLGRLRDGSPKLEILHEIRHSLEARAAAVDVPGLRRAIQCHRASRLPFVGLLVRLMARVEPASTTGTRIRVIEQQAFRAEVQIGARLDRLEARINELHGLAAAQGEHGPRDEQHGPGRRTAHPASHGSDAWSLPADEFFDALSPDHPERPIANAPDQAAPARHTESPLPASTDSSSDPRIVAIALAAAGKWKLGPRIHG